MVSGIAAAFILVNSVAALAGVMTTSYSVPPALPYWALAALAGGYIGAGFGSRRLGNPSIQRLLSLVLLVAGVKMILTAASLAGLARTLECSWSAFARPRLRRPGQGLSVLHELRAQLPAAKGGHA